MKTTFLKLAMVAVAVMFLAPATVALASDCAMSTVAENKAHMEKIGAEFAVHEVTSVIKERLADVAQPGIAASARYIAAARNGAIPAGVIVVGIFDADRCLLGSGQLPARVFYALVAPADVEPQEYRLPGLSRGGDVWKYDI